MILISPPTNVAFSLLTCKHSAGNPSAPCPMTVADEFVCEGE